MSGLLSDRVVLVTGAGNGIGRAHALALAREGARVVVNDLGGARDGSGGSDGPAARVVAEIVAMGGDAVANTDSVSDPAGAARMVAAGVERWGRLDAVVNNAGILRDKTFVKLTPEEWQVVLDVHLGGTQNVIRAALPHLQARGGSIVNTTSYSGMIGNYGQSNYAAAKAGIYGLTRVLALELKKSGVTANCVAPIAKTRMTADIGVVDEEWTPEQIAPVVVFLVSDLARGVTGKVFGVQGQRIHVYEVKTSDGVEKPGKDLWTAQEIADRLGDIESFAAPTPAASVAGPHPVTDAFTLLPHAFRADRAGDFNARIHFKISDGPSQTLVVANGTARVEPGLVAPADCVVSTNSETILGILNQTVDPTKAFMKGKITADNLQVMMRFAMSFDFSAPRPSASPAPTTTAPAPVAAAPTAAATPEVARPRWPIGKIWDGGARFAEPSHAALYAAATNDPSPAYDGPSAICPPMFHVRLFKELLFQIATDRELALDMLRLVHGEHEAVFHRPIRPWDLVQLRARLESVDEKSSGLLVVSKLYAYVDGALAVECRTAYFIRGKKRPEDKLAKEAPPKAVEPAVVPPPDYSVPLEVAPDQSIRYAVASLDDNPIHTDTDTAAAAGLPGIILQGLCTMAMTGAAFVRAAGGGDASRLASLSVRFARPVLNGTTLTAQGWHQPDGTWALETRDASGNVVISHGVAALR